MSSAVRALTARTVWSSKPADDRREGTEVEQLRVEVVRLPATGACRTLPGRAGLHGGFGLAVSHRDGGR